MYGFPKTLNSRADYDNIINDFGYTAQVKMAYEALRDTDKHYVFDRELATAEPATGPEPDYRVVMDQDSRRFQYILVDNPNSKLKQLGFTMTEVEGVIARCTA